MIPVPKYSELSIAKLWPNIKEVPELNIYFPDLKENELPERKYTWSVISTLKPDVVKKLLSEARFKRCINSKDKSESLIKVSREFYDAISAVVCQKRKETIYSLLKYIAHSGIAPFLLRKNAKLTKTREAAKKFPARLSFSESLSRKRYEEEKKESERSPSIYYNTVEMKDDESDQNTKSVRTRIGKDIGFDSTQNPPKTAFK